MKARKQETNRQTGTDTYRVMATQTDKQKAKQNERRTDKQEGGRVRDTQTGRKTINRETEYTIVHNLLLILGHRKQLYH